MDQPSAVGFFQVWDTYAKVVAANYMFHRELGEAIKAALRAHFGDRSFSMLDLGCGDAATLAPLLPGLALKSYQGADLSEAALKLAAKNLSGLSCPVKLVEADFMAALADASPQDAIYSSFAIHHLTTERKADFFRLAAQKLNPNGLLVLVDVTREEGQGLAAYHRAYCDWLRETMVSLSREEADQICDHLVNNDLPEPYSLLETQAEAAGLKPLPGALPQKWHRLMLFAPK
jgi:cyclopropane fatty-acyl-phospholipid synthase-like methyltransferase